MTVAGQLRRAMREQEPATGGHLYCCAMKPIAALQHQGVRARSKQLARDEVLTAVEHKDVNLKLYHHVT